MDKNTSLQALRTLACVAEYNSFSRAAEKLCISASAVSHQMKLLEQQLDMQLFKRRARGVELTDAGTQLARYASRGIQQLQTGLRVAGTVADRQRLVIAVTPSFGQRWLQPRLGDFYQQHADIELQLIAQDRLVDFNQQAIDMHIHFGDGQPIGLRSQFLLAESAVPVCHPSLLSNTSDPLLLIANTHTRLLHYQAGSEDEPGGLSWHDWFSRYDLSQNPAQANSYFSHLSMALDAAKYQQGVALAWRSLIEQDIESRELMCLVDEGVALKYSHYLIAPEHHWQKPSLQQFCQWLQLQTET